MRWTGWPVGDGNTRSPAFAGQASRQRFSSWTSSAHSGTARSPDMCFRQVEHRSGGGTGNPAQRPPNVQLARAELDAAQRAARTSPMRAPVRLAVMISARSKPGRALSIRLRTSDGSRISALRTTWSPRDSPSCTSPLPMRSGRAERGGVGHAKGMTLSELEDRGGRAHDAIATRVLPRAGGRVLRNTMCTTDNALCHGVSWIQQHRP